MFFFLAKVVASKSFSCALASSSGFGAGFGAEKLHSCQIALEWPRQCCCMLRLCAYRSVPQVMVATAPFLLNCRLVRFCQIAFGRSDSFPSVPTEPCQNCCNLFACLLTTFSALFTKCFRHFFHHASTTYTTTAEPGPEGSIYCSFRLINRICDVHRSKILQQSCS